MRKRLFFIYCCLALATVANASTIKERGDGGAAVVVNPHNYELLNIQAILKNNKLKDSVVIQSRIHTLGGGVRGFGVLAEYKKAPLQITVIRSTVPTTKEPYTPVALIKIIDPTGKTVNVLDVSNQRKPVQVYNLNIPRSNTGIWNFSIIGGRQFDRFALIFPKTNVWGVRGEMSLVLNDSLPNPAWLYLPSSIHSVVIEGYNKYDTIKVYDQSDKLLGSPVRHPTSGRRTLLQLDKLAGNSLLKITFPVNAQAVMLIDGVPGLLCPSPEVARKLKGGTVKVNGMTTAGPLQARAWRWMTAVDPATLKFTKKTVNWITKDLKHPEAEAQIVAALASLKQQFAKQNIDRASSWFGTDTKPNNKPGWHNFQYKLVAPWYSFKLAIAAGIKSPINAYYNDPVVVRRAALAGLAPVMMLQGDYLPHDKFMDKHNRNGYPLTHAFFIYSGLSATCKYMQNVLEPEVRAIWLEVLENIGDRLADHQGYQANQWTHNLEGHLNTYLITGKKRFLRFFETQISAYIDGAWGMNAKFGQHPAGFYLEQYGADGNYGNMNLTSIARFYYVYREIPEAKSEITAKLKKSIERNLRFRSYFIMPAPGASLIEPGAFNSRRSESSLFCSNPAGTYLASREFDLAYTRTSLTPMPKRGIYPASVFSYYAHTREWGIRMVNEYQAGHGSIRGFSVEHKKVYSKYPQTAKQVTLPALQEKLFDELPGLIAAKKNGIYALCFYDVAGASPKQKLLGYMGGGPTALSTQATGTFLASMAPDKALFKKKPVDALAFSCVYAKNSKGKLIYSGKERAYAKIIKPGKKWRIDSNFGNGTLRWEYEFTNEGLQIKVTLRYADVKDAWVNLPLALLKQYKWQYQLGKTRLNDNSGKTLLEIECPKNSVLADPVNYYQSRSRKVQCLRIPFKDNKATIFLTTK